jgi:thioredoxin-like negative regulator of GroEL
MKARLLGLCLGLSVGCQALAPSHLLAPSEPAAEESNAPVTPPVDTNDSLQQAASCVERGDEAGAVPHMLHHVQAHPDQIMIRAYLAELLLRLKRLPEAQWHFERFIADAQQATGPSNQHLIHCHTRLMEIAQDREDAYAEHLHRGIGLLLLARQKGVLAQADDPALPQKLLCRAAKELNEAQTLRPGEARPCVYLFEVWTALDQPLPASKALRQVRAEAAFSTHLTPAERRVVALASSYELPGRR